VKKYSFPQVYALGLIAPFAAAAQDHVPPDPPSAPMPAMSDAQMADVMQMDDAASVAMLKLDQLESSGDAGRRAAWEAEAWYGGDFDKAWLRSEGEEAHGRTEARAELFWDHAYASFWDSQLGVRRDFGHGPSRDWVAFGVQGLAPYWFELEATAYLGDGGRSAARLRCEYELLLTQRLILQPELEANFYSRRDLARETSAGLADASLGLRMRYEIRREFAPYVGVVREWRNGLKDDTEVVLGIRLWF